MIYDITFKEACQENIVVCIVTQNIFIHSHIVFRNAPYLYEKESKEL